MEPRFFKRGNLAKRRVGRAGTLASMEPRFFKRGNGDVEIRAGKIKFRFNGTTFFQTWKCESNAAAVKSVGTASMEPRFFKRGNTTEKALVKEAANASMEPRFFKRGNLHR